jgi:CRISPR type III-A-associated RAMP protein Csm4
MQPAVLIRLRPLGAWRFGPADGGHDQVDTLYRSDRLYSAVTLAMQRLGLLDEWLDATARAAKPALVFSSLFPFQGDTFYAIPPATLWPPPLALLTTPSPVFLTKIRWKTAHFVPLSVIDSLITGQPILADQWLPDPESACLLRRDRPSSSPFRVVMRSTAAVDRLTHSSDEIKPVACVEFEQNAGLWTVARFAGAEQEQVWSSRLEAALRLLSDSGFGGGRSRGWGQTQAADFQSGSWPAILLPKLGRLLRNAPPAELENGAGALYWLLSLYSPAASDKVDWTGGNYSLTLRGGRVESHSGQGAIKKDVRMVSEGCVLAAGDEPVGSAVDVAPDGFPHPVYRSGLALALRLPLVEVQQKPVEEPSTEEDAIEQAPPSVEEPAPLPPPEQAPPAVEQPDEPAAPVEPPPAIEEPAPPSHLAQEALAIEQSVEPAAPGPEIREPEAPVESPPAIEEPAPPSPPEQAPPIGPPVEEPPQKEPPHEV